MRERRTRADPKSKPNRTSDTNIISLYTRFVPDHEEMPCIEFAMETCIRINNRYSPRFVNFSGGRGAFEVTVIGPGQLFLFHSTSNNLKCRTRIKPGIALIDLKERKYKNYLYATLCADVEMNNQEPLYVGSLIFLHSPGPSGRRLPGIG